MESLTESEIRILRAMIAERTPQTKVMNPEHIDTSKTQASEGAVVDAITRGIVPMNGEAIDNPAVVARVKHTMRKGEALSEWFARTGLGLSQVMSMSRSEISDFVAVVERRDGDGVHRGNLDGRWIHA